MQPSEWINELRAEGYTEAEIQESIELEEQLSAAENLSACTLAGKGAKDDKEKSN